MQDEPAGAVVEPAAAADSPGQDDLDAAVDAKLSAQSIDDFANVLDLCKRALAKGLDEGSTKFAEDPEGPMPCNRVGEALSGRQLDGEFHDGQEDPEQPPPRAIPR